MEGLDPISKKENEILRNLAGGPHGYPRRSSSDYDESRRPIANKATANRDDRLHQELILKDKLEDLYLREIIEYLRNPQGFGVLPPSKHNPIWLALNHKIESEVYRNLP